jgi:hypothetical protein
MKNRPTKSEVRKQTKAAKRFAQSQRSGRVSPEMWRLMCPKVSR